ncbi:type II toxin-antitoxin system RelE/ParE family toxin [Aliifodinibius salipaludis]|uniref:type II toxin-antitoxin system RelE/ParE family toxin n=1 Tax=Fodinibius salipaludis TaxID=2032627 RepID=UPI001140DF21|nr:type II toxin-antitoxin system RelE/ParE family toxin [Aliifodinibius salipaludis]
MPTDYNVVWSDEADRNVDSILNYLKEAWNRETANDFLGELLKRVGMIARYPEAFQK